MSGPMLGRLGLGTRLGVGAPVVIGATGVTIANGSSLSEPAGCQAGDFMILMSRGFSVIPAGWTQFTSNEDFYYYGTQIRGASAITPIVVGLNKSASMIAIRGPSDMAGALTGARPIKSFIGSGPFEVEYSTDSVTAVGKLEVVGFTQNASFGTQDGPFTTPAGWVKQMDVLGADSAKDRIAWFTRVTPPNPTGVPTFRTPYASTGGRNYLDAHVVL